MSRILTSKIPTPVLQGSPSRGSLNTSPTRTTKPANRTPSTSQLRSNPNDSKISTGDKSLKGEYSPPLSFRKLTSQLLTDNNLGCSNLISDYSLDFGNLNQTNTNSPIKDITQESTREEYVDEMTSLRRELAAKNEVIEKLKTENLGLRREIEEFISIADKIHFNLDEELRQYEKKMTALEQENKDLLAENRFYKEQTQKRFQHKSSFDRIPPLESIVNSVTDISVSKIDQAKSLNEEGYYFQVKDILAMGTAKHQFDMLNKEMRPETSPQKDRRISPTRQKEEEKAVRATSQSKKEVDRSPVRKSSNSVHLTRHSTGILAKIPGKVLDRKSSTDFTAERRGNTSHLKG